MHQKPRRHFYWTPCIHRSTWSHIWFIHNFCFLYVTIWFQSFNHSNSSFRFTLGKLDRSLLATRSVNKSHNYRARLRTGLLAPTPPNIKNVLSNTAKIRKISSNSFRWWMSCDLNVNLITKIAKLSNKFFASSKLSWRDTVMLYKSDTGFWDLQRSFYVKYILRQKFCV